MRNLQSTEAWVGVASPRGSRQVGPGWPREGKASWIGSAPRGTAAAGIASCTGPRGAATAASRPTGAALHPQAQLGVTNPQFFITGIQPNP